MPSFQCRNCSKTFNAALKLEKHGKGCHEPAAQLRLQLPSSPGKRYDPAAAAAAAAAATASNPRPPAPRTPLHSPKVQLVQCQNCERTFEPGALVRHRRSCKPAASDDAPDGASIQQGTGDEVLRLFRLQALYGKLLCT